MNDIRLKLSDFTAKSEFGLVGKNTPLNVEINKSKIVVSFQSKTASLLFRILSGRGDILSGTATIDDLDYNDKSHEEWSNITGLGFRDRGLLSNQDLYSNVALPWKYHHHKVQNALTPEEALKECGVAEEFWKQRPHLVPWNVRKWALLARSIVLSPKVLFLDDPTCLLAFDEFNKLYSWIKDQANKGMVVVIGTDEKPFGLAIADQVLDLSESKLYSKEEAPLEQSVLRLGNDMKTFLEETL